ncbi:uncharacterized protein DUF4337 [Stella humosa]|uniref:Uncharacterized protein DUF4337 n=1 Tax=Stella humosa TaxID=94 RepID=A0A3N1M9R1_9PROT|nr:DUF4337 domain-containing protein [Stella humosa]ROQ00378.1 uncharacterized protein DUF4337 [Stella humosa]BBK30383.1 hypothetical protein STHU_10170 [Stella humosa]
MTARKGKAMSGHGAHDSHGGNKRVALLISVLALLLAVSETLGKAAQTTTIGENIEAANYWSFFQAKTIRMTVTRTAAEELETLLPVTTDPEQKKRLEARIDRWQKTAARYDSEPETGEGRRELAEKAKAAQAKRDHAQAAYHHYEVGSAAFQIAIVLASAAIITGAMALVGVAGVLGLAGAAMTAIGFFIPEAVHLF